jgi:F0F1-type ATP synthase membrane subunit b/b'
MPEARYYRIVLWSLVIFVLVVATPGWYIQKQMAQKLHHLEDRVATLEEQAEELKSQPAGGQTEEPAMGTEDDGR